MGNTNFQTIHQMGTAISDFVKQATGRDNVQNIDMDHITVAQNHRYEEVDVSGRVVSFYAGEAGLPFEKMVVQIKPVQDLHGYDSPWPAGGGKNLFGGTFTELFPISILSGTVVTAFTDGDTTVRYYDANKDQIDYWRLTTEVAGGYTRTFTLIADAYYFSFTGGTTITQMYVAVENSFSGFAPYSNICPITGWTMVNVYQSGQNMEDARVYRFPFPSEAGIVYGGTLDVVTGEMVVDRASVNLGTLGWAKNEHQLFGTYFYAEITSLGVKYDGPFNSTVYNALCSNYKVAYRNIYEFVDNTFVFDGTITTGSVTQIQIKDSAYSDAASFKAALTASNAQLVYELATPVSYTLSASQVQTILGQNHIWADTGDIEVKFTNVKELY